MNPQDVLLPIESLASQLGWSRALVRVVLDAGCPRAGESASLRWVLAWMRINYNAVRNLAGFKPLPPPPDGSTMQELATHHMRCYLLTVVEFHASRSTHPRVKREYEVTAEQLRQRVGDCGE